MTNDRYPPSSIWDKPNIIDYSETQKLILYILYYVTPPLSLVGSLCIIYVVWKGRFLIRNRSNLVHHGPRPMCVRLLLGYSLMDVIASTGCLIFGPWSTPKGTPFVYAAVGTLQTCEANGFFFNTYTGLCIYSGCLALYYALTIRLEWKEEYVTKKFEPLFHIFAWTFPLLTSAVAVSLGYFNPEGGLPGFCWITDMPPDCSKVGSPCYRGPHAFLFSVIISCGSVILSFFVSLISFGLVYFKVRATEKKLAEYGRNHQSSASRLALTRQTCYQAMSYMGAFFFCNVSILVLQGLPTVKKGNEHLYFPASVVFMILFPLQGFFHACMFLTKHHRCFADEAPRLHAFVARFASTTSEGENLKRNRCHYASRFGSVGPGHADDVDQQEIKRVAMRRSLQSETILESTQNNTDSETGIPYETEQQWDEEEFQRMFGVTFEIAMKLIQCCIENDPEKFQ